MHTLRIVANNADELSILKKHQGKVVWSGPGGWIVEVPATKHGLVTIKFTDGTLYNPKANLSDLLEEAKAIKN